MCAGSSGCIVNGTELLTTERGFPMHSTSNTTPTGRATAIFESEPEPALRCSHCAAPITDDDADCPACDSPLDWGASMAALRSWQRSRAEDAASGQPGN